MLANILRTDAHVHRTLPDDTDLACAIAVLARAHQDATWRRINASNELRSMLREYYPAFLDAFTHRKGFLASADAHAVLAFAPTPAVAGKLTKTRITAALPRGGRKCGTDQLAAELHTALRVPHLRQQPLVEQAMGAAALALLAALDAACTNLDQLGEACTEAFTQHPDYEIITSFPGLGDLTGARVLAEIGDDRSGFTDAPCGQGLRRLGAGHQRIRPQHLHHPSEIKNDRLAAAGYVWAFIATNNWPGARAHYHRRRQTHGDRHAAAHGTCSTDSSAASTNACPPARPTTRPPPFPTRSRPPLDLYLRSEVLSHSLPCSSRAPPRMDAHRRSASSGWCGAV